jgi:hypothetical protein
MILSAFCYLFKIYTTFLYIFFKTIIIQHSQANNIINVKTNLPS